MPPTRTSPGFSPQHPASLSSIPFRFRRKSLSENDLLQHDRALLPSPSLSPSLSMSMSSSPPSSPTALSTSPARPSHLDTAQVRQPSSPLRPAAHHAYGYAYAYPRGGSHPDRYDYDLFPAEHLPKAFPSRSHAYAVIPPLTSSTCSSSSSRSPTHLDGFNLFHSASENGSHHDADDDMEDAYGFALDMDGILGASSPSRRVSFTTSSERDRPFVRPPAPVPVQLQPPARMKKAVAPPMTASPVPATSGIPRTTPVTAAGTGCSVPALPQTMPRRPSTPVCPRTNTRSPSVRPSAVADDTDVLPPSSPFPSPLSSPTKADEAEAEHGHPRDMTLPPSSPIAIPQTPARETVGHVGLEFDWTPSPPSPTLDALRITSRVAVRALLNPEPESALPVARTLTPEPIAHTIGAREDSSRLETDGDVTSFVLGEAEAETTVVISKMTDAKDDVLVRGPGTTSRAYSCVPHVQSRESTPERAVSPDTPSSPLSSPPRSIADERDVAPALDVNADVEVEVELPSNPVSVTASLPSSRSSSIGRGRSVQHEKSALEPPRKKARLENEAASAVPRTLSAKIEAVEAEIPRARTESPQESEREGKDVKAKAIARKSEPAPGEQRQRPKHSETQKKRRRVVWSDDESESDAPAPIQAQARKEKEKEAGSERKRTGNREKERERTKKPRVKEGSVGDVENEPLDGATTKPKQAAKTGARAAAPKSATNIARSGSAQTRSIGQEPKQDPPSSPEYETPKTGSKPNTEQQLDAPPAPEPHSPKRTRKEEPDAPALPAYTLPLPAGELEGMLIETLATARASSLATSALYGALMAARPALREMALPVPADAKVAEALERECEREREEREKKGKGAGRGRGARADADAASRRAWVPALEGVLEAGRRRSGVFGKVVNCGTDTGDQELALEARWFYDPERDQDAERAALVRSMMRRPGKRSETKKAKQYYWRPLPKISRWDPEDEL